ncbi:MAG: hypothetical protein FJ308_13610 [Planctomycetes bacterium]|nr:hypothetical protein [Planctomycetota bacterium]
MAIAGGVVIATNTMLVVAGSNVPKGTDGERQSRSQTRTSFSASSAVVSSKAIAGGVLIATNTMLVVVGSNVPKGTDG